MTLKNRENKFKLIGGSAGVDFVNTVGGRLSSGKGRHYQSAIQRDKLEDYFDLLAWAKKSSLLSSNDARLLETKAKENPRAAEGILKRALELREVVYRLLKSAIDGWQPEPADLRRLNDELKLARKHETLIHDRQGFRIHWQEEEVSLDRVLSLLARSAAEVLTSTKLSRVKQCDGDNCGWIFLDTSRSGNRTWCDMKDCGNLAKVHRFRKKKRAA